MMLEILEVGMQGEQNNDDAVSPRQATVHEDIANHYVEYLKENPDVCAQRCAPTPNQWYIRRYGDVWVLVKSGAPHNNIFEMSKTERDQVVAEKLEDSPVWLRPVGEAGKNLRFDSIWEHLEKEIKEEVLE